MTLTQALNEVGKIVGKSTYKHVQIAITGFGKKNRKKEEIKIDWGITSGNTSGFYTGSTLKEVLQKIKAAHKPKKKRFQDVKV